eukprot:TRINITY_DN57144_c0_g1_i1.p3 TRINITY_DN57144_c0_g1~~TRINITY_DN57144_c0_g1_i1.p3  ORF type:complete len:133 (-),score=21.86 TRINITY_DN57144_c0_g1_i1:185-541(-)
MFRSVAVLAFLASASAAFYQLQCTDSSCSQNCRRITFPEGQCIPVEGGGSAKITCQTGSIKEEIWSNSDCSGTPAHTGSDQTGVCEKSTTPGTFYENVCTSNLLINAEVGSKLNRSRW